MKTRDSQNVAAQKAGWNDLLQGRNALRSIALAGGVALHAVNVYVTITILPSVVRDIGGLDFYAWNTTLFILTSIVGSAVSPQILTSFGPRGGYRLATTIFIIGTMICALAPAMAVLLIGRTVQGFGGGVLFALSYAMIRIIFAESLWPRAMALVSGMWGVATLVGPALGGVFAEFDIWRGAFWSLLIIAIPYMALTSYVLPKKDEQKRGDKTPLAVTQVLLLAVAVLTISVGSLSDSPGPNAVGVIVAIVIISMLVAVERRSNARLLPAGAFSLKASLGPIYLTMGLLVIGMQTEIYVPYFLQVLHGVTPLVAGYLAALMAVGWTIAAFLVSGASPKRARAAIIGGPVLVLIALLSLAVFMPGWLAIGKGNLVAICAGLTLTGFGIGVAWPHLLTRVLQVSSESETEKASAGITTIQLFATALGASLTGMITNLAGLSNSGGEIGAYNAALWLFAAYAVAPLVAIASAARVTKGAERERSSASFEHRAH